MAFGPKLGKDFDADLLNPHVQAADRLRLAARRGFLLDAELALQEEDPRWAHDLQSVADSPDALRVYDDTLEGIRARQAEMQSDSI